MFYAIFLLNFLAIISLDFDFLFYIIHFKNVIKNKKLINYKNKCLLL